MPSYVRREGPLGRPRGSPNKLPATLKEMILKALNDAGGQKYLRIQAEKNPTAFMTLLGKILPLTVAGDRNNPITHTISQSDSELINRYLEQRGINDPRRADIVVGTEEQVTLQ